MNTICLAISIVLSIFSTAVMSYISMATPIGPWIAPTLVLLAIICMKLCRVSKNVDALIAYVTVAGSVGGILATAFGFSFPAIYFLNAPFFTEWISNPYLFCFQISMFGLLAGWFGIFIANTLEQKLIVQEKLAFPIGQLVQKMIAAHTNTRKAYELIAGFISTAFFCVLQDGTRFFKGIIAKSIPLLPATTVSVISFPAIQFDLWPLLWAIGFVTGHVVALPLLVGAAVKLLFMEPVNKLFFPTLPAMDFVLAFCGGLVLSGTVLGFADTPKTIYKAIKRWWLGSATHQRPLLYRLFAENQYHLVEFSLLLICLLSFLSYLDFSYTVQWYLIVCTWMCTYQMVVVAGKIGLAQLGRYATFVMVPAMFLFSLTSQQLILIATFVEVAGGVATDILFGRKLGYEAHISLRKIRFYQYFGLLCSCISLGIILWLLINHFTLGSTELFAYKAQSRALLINVQYFDYKALMIGFMAGLILKYMKMNPALVLGGLLMPINISLGLIVGGFVSYVCKDKEEWYPFWSGVFASNSLWMLLKAVF